MRIPLDYYRILGIPIQVTLEQLHQAYQDRSLQLPRREYSDQAIALRKQLLDEAYEVLSDPDKRSEYDGSFLEKTYPLDLPSTVSETEQSEDSFFDNHTPWLEIDPEQLVGALLILQELGEYELVIYLGNDYLNSTPSYSQTLQEDVILTLALAELELSREYWQQRAYEKAAESNNKGLNLLRKENLFTHIQAEIEDDFYKLRPYRILELLALPQTQTQDRNQGLQLLGEMLEERNGIDGKGNDRSGLSLDDFLRFIQQLRIYLTVIEQEKLFGAEASRPSPVASYLHVYTLMALGFAHKKPDAILQAKIMLNRLGKRQDVQIEKAICCLLLGQTEEASSVLEQSRETATLQFIKDQSQGAPDLLPGLCLYGERWLQTEVFSHFRDLSTEKVSLKEYFADGQVQNYLEQLSVESQPSNSDLYIPSLTPITETFPAQQSIWLPDTPEPRRERQVVMATGYSEIYGVSETTETTTATMVKPKASSRGNATQMKRYEESNQEYNHGNVALNPAYRDPVSDRRSRRKRKRAKPENITQSIPEPSPVLTPPLRKTKAKPKKFLKRRLGVGILMLVGLGACTMLVKSLQSNRAPVALLESNNLEIGLTRPPLDIPRAEASLIIAGTLTPETAQLMIEEWLTNKSQAMGNTYQIDSLKAVLTQPMLSTWGDRAERLKSGKSYYQYQHQIKVRSVNLNKKDPNQALVEAQVKEVAKFYQDGKLNAQKSYDDNLLIRYELIRQGDQWKIKDSQVLSQ